MTYPDMIGPNINKTVLTWSNLAQLGPTQHKLY